MKKIEVAIIGAGPAGLATANKLCEKGIENIAVFERNNFLGGILIQCIHTGFGLTYFKKDLTGPEYAYKLSTKFLKNKIPYFLNSMVTDLTQNKILTTFSKKHGLKQFKAKAVIIATGCRERTRENLEVAGTRPAGVFTAGQAQHLINLDGYKIGNNIIIQGSGDIGLIMARRLTIEGYHVIKVFEKLPRLSGLIRNKVQCLDEFNIPIEFNTQITEIMGKDRVNGAYTENSRSKLKSFYPCDTVLFSVGLIPEIDLATKAGITSSNHFNADVDNKFETNLDGIFICGNALHIHDLADNASREGEKAAEHVALYLKNYAKFSSEKNKTSPYKNSEKNETYSEEFLKQLKKENKKICIVCPKSCDLSKGNYPCKKGETFFNCDEKLRHLTTTVEIKTNGSTMRIPIKSEEPVDINNIQLIQEELKKTIELKGGAFYITVNKTKIKFVCANMSETVRNS